MLELEVVGGVAVLTLCRPPVNAMSPEWVTRFNALLDELQGRTDWSVLHLRSAFRLSGQVDHCEAAQAAQKRCS